MNDGLERSNELRCTMFTEPASAAPDDSGVGEYDTSMRDRLLFETMSTCTARAVPPAELARLKPSTVTGTLSEDTPLMEMKRMLPPLFSTVTPGMNLSTSAALPSATPPNSSAEITFLMFAAKRCSLMAIAAPSISRVVPTTNLSSLTTPPAPGSARVSKVCRLTSWRAIWPATTVTSSVRGSKPVKNTRSLTVPAGTFVSR